jgi:hypothetical protein
LLQIDFWGLGASLGERLSFEGVFIVIFLVDVLVQEMICLDVQDLCAGFKDAFDADTEWFPGEISDTATETTVSLTTQRAHSKP